MSVLPFQNCTPLDSKVYSGLSAVTNLGLIGECEKLNDHPSGGPEIKVTSPAPYEVFQRDNTGVGPIHFRGVASSEVDCVEVQYRSRSTGDLSPWIRLPFGPIGSGDRFDVAAGFQSGSYEISIRAVKDKRYGQSFTVRPVGVGDIFIVAGQSNSSFAGDVPLETTTDGMVSFFDGTEWSSCRDSQYDPNVGSSLSRMGRIDPYAPAGNMGLPGLGRQGGSPWCPFGDGLHDKWKVPIAIVPLGIAGTNIFKWLERSNPMVQDLPPYPSYFSTAQWAQSLPLDPSKNGNNVNFAAANIAGAYGYYNFDNDLIHNKYIESPFGGGSWVIENDSSGLCPGSFSLPSGIKYNSCMRAGFPYARLVSRLKFLANRGGLRAVLWHQGESDSVYQETLRSPNMEANYYSKILMSIIVNSRKDSGLADLPWLVSKVGVTLAQWRPGFDSGNLQLPHGSDGVFYPNTVPSAQDVNLMRIQQQRVVDTVPFVFAGVDSDALIGKSADGREVFRSEISFPHFNETGLRALAERWREAVTSAFPVATVGQ